MASSTSTAALGRIPLVDLRAQYAGLKEEIDAAIHRVLEEGRFILGPEVEAFERRFAGYVGAAGAVGCGSGTSALWLALLACGVGPGDEVITTAHTFIATAEAISQAGATPVFADIDPVTYTLDPARVAEAVTSKTKAIIPVHVYGHPADMEAVSDVARRHGLRIIEDAAQAHGAEYRGRRCGALGDLACFSFFPGKILGAYGDAGAVTGHDPELLARVRRLRDHGRSAKYEHDEIGFNERLDALQAAILSAKLPHLEEWVVARRRLATRYHELLRGCSVVTPQEAAGSRHAYHLYVVRAPERDRLVARLRAQGIEAGIHYPVPLHRQPAYLKRGYGVMTLPVTEQAAREIVSLPLYPELTDEQAAFVASAVREALG